MIGVVDTARANIASVCTALDWLGADVQLCHRPEEVLSADQLVLPGVGAFADGMAHLRASGLVEALEEAKGIGRPILGICLGMQLMARRSEEGGDHQGLAWFEADVCRLDPPDHSCRVPHVGWNDARHRTDSPLFAGLPEAPDFYFVHSYQVVCDDEADVDATCTHGTTVTAAIRHENVAGVQFHVEKSQDHGLRLLENFLRWKP